MPFRETVQIAVSTVVICGTDVDQNRDIIKNEA